jgi:general transcription factor IIIA
VRQEVQDCKHSLSSSSAQSSTHAFPDIQKRALTVHHSTAHLGLRPFACPHEQCDNTYGHKHLLQRHIAARHREPSFDEPVLPTGMHALQKMANKALACPCASAELEGERCRQRFGRVYDVKRHVRKIHGLELSESEVRLLLGDAEAGDNQVLV